MKKTEIVRFENVMGEKLMGRLELPADRKPHNFAIFAHCFTCNKNLRAAVNISRELAQKGFGVLRFDFTGLGESEGDFADTNFSGNVEDLVEAAKFLEENYKAPTLLVGHSLGGAAVIFAASQLPEVRAVVTIGAPSDPEHVKRLIKEKEEEILENGKATVQLEGRPFTIKKQFLDDLKDKYLPEVVKDFGKALLILHSPQDRTVGIKNAEDIYINARHPKSFVSLDGANHLLTRKEDASYAGSVIAQWATRYVDIPPTKDLRSDSNIAANLKVKEGFTTQMKLGVHYMTADEPVSVGGNNFGPNPYDYVTGGLAACKAMTVKMYAERKGWEVENISVFINHSKDYATDCEQCEDNKSARIDVFECELEFEGNLTPEQKNRMLQIADRCPVHRTLTEDVAIKSKLKE